MASTYLTRTPSSTGNRKTWTISGWIKRCETSTSSLQIFSAGEYAVTDLVQIYTSSHKLYCGMYNSSGTEISSLITSRLFRDTNAFYHIVVAVDTTQATASNRVKIYINGVQETAFDTENYPTQNYDTAFNTTNQNTIGSVKGNTQYFDGIMSHVHLIDGTQYQASDFGEYDANGVWKIKTSPSVTYGTNGFFILKDSASVTDQSGNGNNFTVAGGTLTDTLDCSANVFATLNPLNVPTSNAPTFSNGNTKVVTSTGGNFGGSSTLGASSGKYYFEIKFTAESASNMGNINLSSSENAREMARTNQHANQFPSEAYPSFTYEYPGDVYKDSGSSVGNYGGFAVGDIVMIAMDLDNQFAYFGVNGTWGNSSDPTSGATGTGGAAMSANSEFWHLSLGDRNSAATATYEVNFGNGYFGTTAVASAGTNASGNGIFEYDVPTGYTALCTKGLNGE